MRSCQWKSVALSVAVLLASIGLGGCSSDGSSDGSAATNASDAATINEASKPQPTVHLVWQHVRDGPVLRFVADVHNPGSAPIVGLNRPGIRGGSIP
jgi:hypothetical protein